MYLIRALGLLFSSLLLSIASFGQTQDSYSLEMDSVTISASRINAPLAKIPMAVSQITDISHFDANQKSSLKEFLVNQPGLFIQSAANNAQDLRISIRGFGARSAFGIRGVKIIVDGIPESTPDGQGQIDNINLKSIASINILRGPSSGLYGNASGGVISINNHQTVQKRFLEVDHYFGSNATIHSSILSGMKLGDSDLIINGSFFSTGGYRAHSESETGILAAHWKNQIRNNLEVKLSANYAFSGEAQDAGSLNLEDVNEDRRQARQRNVDFDSGEEIGHLKLAGSFKLKDENRTYTSALYYHNRQFDGRLPFVGGGIVDLSRQFLGHHSHFRINRASDKIDNHFLVGYDIQVQDDDRKRYNNEMGVTGDLSLDQIEQFENYALFIEDRATFAHGLYLNLDARYDRNNIHLDDQFIIDEDDSYNIDYNSVNFGIGAGYNVGKSVMPYLRIASSFETPTLSELFADPDGTGFNKALQPNKSYNYELGMKSKIATYFNFDVNAFFIQSSDEILPFELEAFPGRDFFRNAGSTNRIGTELFLDFIAKSKFDFNLSYSWSHFTFNDYELEGKPFDGNDIPGVPLHNVGFNLFYDLPFKFQIVSMNQWVSKLYANDDNSVEVDGYIVCDVKLEKSFAVRNTQFDLYGGINNILAAEYFDNVRINAFGGRYYEAAVQRNFYLGLKMRFE